ncbi:MAG TPA: hypothetical protein PK295_01805 [Candidatus Magasanikbacteria bacterium]|nr:hypothetical protein [Candidatus Magasanikbacteria bacterium]
MSVKDIIHEIDSRFQLALTISILFPTFLATIFQRIENSGTQVAQTTLAWSFLIGVYLLDYIFFSVTKNKLTNCSYKWINRILLIGLSLFILPILIVSASKLDGKISGWFDYIGLQGSLWGLLISPFVLLTILLSSKVAYLINKE